VSLSQKVDDLWWEGTTLFMEIEGHVWRFKDARFTGIEYGKVECENIQITPIEFVEIKVDDE